MQNINYSVLLVDDDQDVLDAYSHLMDLAGFNAKALLDPRLASRYLNPDWPGVVILDMYMPQMHGMELLKQIKATDPKIPVIVITGHGDIPMAVDALKMGACEFIEKPINPSELLEMVKVNLDQRTAFIEQKKQLLTTIDRALIGHSAQMEHIRYCVSQFALLPSHVVLWGESGTGRHLIAQLIHDMSRNSRTLSVIAVDGDTDQKQLDDQLQHLSSGTLIIDHAEQLTEENQRYLAQQLITHERNGQEGRVIAILGEQPETLIAKQRLTPELYFLLSQGVIDVPTLRQRPDDIAVLFHHFLKLSCKKLAKTLPKVESNYLSLLRSHQWPGNVRELRNVAELYAIGIIKLTGKDKLYTQEESLLPLDELIGDFEKGVIEDALFLHSGRVSDAAEYLQVPRKKLYLRMKKHGIDKDSFKLSVFKR